MRAWSLAILTGLLVQSAATAQAPAWRYQWQKGQVLLYRASQVTEVAEEVGGKKVETRTQLNHIKRWQVLDVDAAGVATLRLSLAAMRLETTTPDGDKLVYDSAKPADSNPEMAEQLNQYVGTPLAVLRVGPLGQVVEVKESRFGSGSKYDSEPPFPLLLPAQNPTAVRAWERTYAITLDPPHGTGEKYQAVQKYSLKSMDQAQAVIGLTTELKTQPEAVGDRVPLLRLLPQGELTFQHTNGVLLRAVLQVDQELTGHEGTGSRYRFKSAYSEEYVADR